MFMRFKAVRLAMIGALVLGAMVSASPATAASGGGCELNGTAGFSPGLTNTSQNFSYSFAGSLTSCQSSVAGAPTSGSVEAGKTVTRQVVNSITGATDTVTYQEPVPSGTGSCGTSTTGGASIVTWSDGTQTVIDYTTTGAAAAVDLDGSVVPSVTLNAINAVAGDPTTITISTTRYAGYGSMGLLTFQPPDPTACGGAGVTTAAIGGIVGLGTSA